jgi:hypothetical protein
VAVDDIYCMCKQGDKVADLLSIGIHRKKKIGIQKKKGQ